ncbi:putative transcriptional regulator [Clostridium saccharobutylicum]|nr:hypothetical protein CLOSC_33100 [Clostridium saccharobutylicum]OAV38968.1 hypothetical protein M945_3598 [Clostridium saccharobutylicum DSM 13864]AQS01489.1 hypothetical protein CSACC_33180 [Clostridium saccharobutylicum]AQS15472.1 hypothetical protein CLOSACC_33180 [Clostridium saccharobutylicum]MBA2906997.1 putative transcriptional regulator [Clostridium saccharobutylicum]
MNILRKNINVINLIDNIPIRYFTFNIKLNYCIFKFRYKLRIIPTSKKGIPKCQKTS